MKETIVVADGYISKLIVKIIIIHHQFPQLRAGKSRRLLIDEIIAPDCADIGALC